MKKSSIHIHKADGETVSFSADFSTSITIEKKKSMDSIHIADALHAVMLEVLREEGGSARLDPGTYGVTVTFSVGRTYAVPEGENEVSEPNDS